jgi:hypothetical protein
MNGRSMLFGEDGLARACGRWAGVDLKRMVECVFDEVDQFLGGEPRRDDQALLAVEVTE